jgi:hypothetical protein
MRRLPAIAVCLLISLYATGCGDTPTSSSGAVQQFVTAVTHNDRSTWCDRIGSGLMSAGDVGGLQRSMLARCKRSDLFAITASCDREAVISGASVAGDIVHGDRADVQLTSGARLGLQRSAGQWYVISIVGGSPQAIKQGPCAGAGGA